MPRYRVGIELRRTWETVREVEARNRSQAIALAKEALRCECADTPDSESLLTYFCEEVVENRLPTPMPKDQLPLPLEV